MKANKTLLIAMAAGVVLGGVGVASMKSWVAPALAQKIAPANMRTISNISTEDMTALKGLDGSFASLAEFVAPTVVNITSEGSGGTDMMGNRMGAVSGVGTGVIFRSDGWIITNDHVVNGFDKVTVTLNDGREFKGTVRQVNESDIAVVKIDATNLTAASFADSGKVRVGEFTMAVGSPFGLENSVTFGHVSGLGRQNQIPDSRLKAQIRYYPDLIQTDAPINQGNSGGPLFNIDGQVVGINTAIASSTGGSNGIGFAIPSNLVRTLAEMLIEKGKVTRGAIGLIPVDLKPYQKKDMNIDGGAVVYSLDNDTPAAKAGIKKDDVIVRVGNVPIKNQLDVRMAMYHIAPGSKVDVEVIRGGQHKTIGVNVVDSEDLMKELDKKNPRPQQQQQFNGGNDGGQSDPFQEFPDIKRLFPNQRGGNDNGDDKQPAQPHTGPARLGVGISDISDAARSQFDIPANVTGAVVGSVEKGSSADIIGIEPGMVIQELNGKTIRSAADIKEAMKNVKWGDTVHIKYGRYSKGATMQSEQDVKIR